jgi:hypothetical protein
MPLSEIRNNKGISDAPYGTKIEASGIIEDDGKTIKFKAEKK